MAMKDMTARDLNRLARFLGKVMDTLREHSTLDDTINYDVAMLFDWLGPLSSFLYRDPMSPD